jgi:hypothetical protein
MAVHIVPTPMRPRALASQACRLAPAFANALAQLTGSLRELLPFEAGVGQL